MKKILLTAVLTISLALRAATYQGVCIDHYRYRATLFSWDTHQYYPCTVVFGGKLVTVWFESGNYCVLDLTTQDLPNLRSIKCFDWDNMTYYSVCLTHPFED